MSLIKPTTDLTLIKTAGAILGKVLLMAEQEAKIGVSLEDLDQKIDDMIVNNGCKPSFKGHEGFPAAACLSLNQQVVHGIPDSRILKEGDILGIDVGLWLKNVCVDAAITVGIGKISDEARTLLDDTKKALAIGIKAIKPYRRVGIISSTIQDYGEKTGHGIVRNLTGHGVGHAVHEEPSIPNYGKAQDGMLLKPGMVLAIEPMFTNGHGEVLTEVDGWGIVTADGSLAAQFEHTVIITNKGAQVVTSAN